MSLPEVTALLGLNLALIVVVMLVLWGLALRLKDVSFCDVGSGSGLFTATAKLPRPGLRGFGQRRSRRSC